MYNIRENNIKLNQAREDANTKQAQKNRTETSSQPNEPELKPNENEAIQRESERDLNEKRAEQTAGGKPGEASGRQAKRIERNGTETQNDTFEIQTMNRLNSQKAEQEA